MVCTRVQACLKFSTFSYQRPSSPTIPIRSRRFALESKTGQAAPGSGRRFKQSSKGKRARRKKKSDHWGSPASRPFRSVSPWYIEISPSRCWPKFRWSRLEKDSTRARTIMWGGGRRRPEQTRGWIANWPGYRCIFNTETKRYNPRLIGKLHLGRPPSPIQIAGVRYRGYHPFSPPQPRPPSREFVFVGDNAWWFERSRCLRTE